MTLREWYDFNHEVFASVEWKICVCILDGTYNNDKKILETVIKNYYANKIFGNYELKKIQTTIYEGYSYIKLILWPPTKE